MRSRTKFIWLVLGLFLVIACTSESPPAATQAPPPDIGATVTAMVEDLPTQTPYPTLVALPTHTPYPALEPLPTYTPVPPASPYPTYTPIPPATPYPTYTPAPTAEPYPTYTPAPAATPYPTLKPLPTHTPQPAPAARTIVKQDNWKVDGFGAHSVLGTTEDRGTWLLVLGCVDEEPNAWIWRTVNNIFTSTEPSDEVILADYDGDSLEQTWTHIPDDGGDFLVAIWPGPAIERMLEHERVIYTIPTAGEPYIVTFEIAGLDQHIGKPSDLCK